MQITLEDPNSATHRVKIRFFCSYKGDNDDNFSLAHTIRKLFQVSRAEMGREPLTQSSMSTERITLNVKLLEPRKRSGLDNVKDILPPKKKKKGEDETEVKDTRFDNMKQFRLSKQFALLNTWHVCF